MKSNDEKGAGRKSLREMIGWLGYIRSGEKKTAVRQVSRDGRVEDAAGLFRSMLEWLGLDTRSPS